MSKHFYYVVIETAGQRRFINCDGKLTDLFDNVMRFPDKAAAQQYLKNHPRQVGRADVIGMLA